MKLQPRISLRLEIHDANCRVCGTACPREWAERCNQCGLEDASLGPLRGDSLRRRVVEIIADRIERAAEAAEEKLAL